MTSGHAVMLSLGEFLIFVPDCILDQFFRIVVPTFQSTKITGVHNDCDATKDVTFFGMLLEGDLLIGSHNAADFAKEAAIRFSKCEHAWLCSFVNPICSLAQLACTECEQLHRRSEKSGNYQES